MPAKTPERFRAFGQSSEVVRALGLNKNLNVSPLCLIRNSSVVSRNVLFFDGPLKIVDPLHFHTIQNALGD